MNSPEPAVVGPRPRPSGTSPTRPAAVLWDFDGTLADTEPLWIEAEFELMERHGRTDWSLEHAHQLVGNALIDTGRYIVDFLGRDDLDPVEVSNVLTDAVVARIGSSDELAWRPGALDLLGQLRRDGVPCALVSASYRRMLDAVLTRLPAGSFDVVVAGDEVIRGKPDPEPYLTACTRLGVDPADCVVLEDSTTGADSGNAAGAVVVAIEHMVDIPAAPQRHFVHSLAGLGTEDLAAFLAPSPSRPEARTGDHRG
ncbi:MAG: HAD family hydrolase [Propionibacteriaceae bacterium]